MATNRPKVVVIIPARYKSSRFPAKVLANKTGKYLIQHTYEQACKSKLANDVIIAADDQRILAAAKSFGARCVLTDEHPTGTDRVAEVAAELRVDIVVNLQADEPEIDPAHIDRVAELLIESADGDISTLGTTFQSPEQVLDPNIVKVVTDTFGRAIYFSRSVIPYDRQAGGVGPLAYYMRHVGIYAYRRQVLLELTNLPQTPLERLEQLEQLRAIESGYTILVGQVDHAYDGIDTPQQYEAFVRRYKADTA
ncbi:MAG: 3-deoxy-manno-octulosonate cytidylyltransferase [Sedimentisphaerales bacterium]|nr:3-deoxy-manno-octulosonate cytidylyltransferase [Sedimentisphaerales bacterium]